MPPVTLTAWTRGIGAVLLHAGSLALGEHQAVPTNPDFLAVLVYLGIVPSGIRFVLYFGLLERAGALQAILVVYVVPVVVVVVIGWLWLGETLSPVTLLGFAVVFTGFVVLKFEEVAAVVTGVADRRTTPHRWLRVRTSGRESPTAS